MLAAAGADADPVVALLAEDDLHPALADLALVAVRGRGVDVPVPGPERDLDGLLDEARLRLPGACAPQSARPRTALCEGGRTEAERGHLRPGVELHGL